MQPPAGRAVGHPLPMSNQQTEADKAIGQPFDHELAESIEEIAAHLPSDPHPDAGGEQA